MDEMQPLTQNEAGLLTGGFTDASPVDNECSLTATNAVCLNANCNSTAKNRKECSNTNCTLRCECNDPHYGQIGNSGC